MKRQTKVVEFVYPKTKEETIRQTMEYFVETIESRLKFSKKDLDEFAAKFAENPLRALEWSADTFKKAAEFEAASIVKIMYDHQLEQRKNEQYLAKTDLQILESIRDRFREEVIRKAKWPDRSSSVPSNEVSIYLNSAKAEWLETLDQFVKKIRKAGE